MAGDDPSDGATRGVSVRLQNPTEGAGAAPSAAGVSSAMVGMMDSSTTAAAEAAASAGAIAASEAAAGVAMEFMKSNPEDGAAEATEDGAGFSTAGSVAVVVVDSGIMNENPLVTLAEAVAVAAGEDGFGVAGAGSGAVGFKKENEETAAAAGAGGAAGAGSAGAPTFMKPNELMAAGTEGSGAGSVSALPSVSLDAAPPLSSRPPNIAWIDLDLDFGFDFGFDCGGSFFVIYNMYGALFLGSR